ncbi:MAG: nitrile hydratase subunit beta [SAR86 cluster bacterium]|uniref:Nitrile hydratase subunit beta n=1 Tax=SAR86 cluster bacterium TaxID=2030880 RepID=A0A2A4XAQ2_9GAMM|nr:MAG: nitrile hydratase subunit beta [SAR86 cluster bacterium]
MKGGHDLGGQPEMGPINPEPESKEPVFHAEWERRVFGLTLATGMLGKWNIDESRHARERQDPLAYVENSYYENWLEGLEKLLVEKGLVDIEELGQTASTLPQTTESLTVPNPEIAQKILSAGAPSTMGTDSEPLFRSGDSVLVRASEIAGHTRAPRYAQGVIGTVAAQLGCHSFPDSNALGIHEGKFLYRVIFSGVDLWSHSSTQTEVLIDLWEPYLVAAAN